MKLQRFNREGQPSGSEIQVSTTDVDPAHRPAITGMIDGASSSAGWTRGRISVSARNVSASTDRKKTPSFGSIPPDGFHQAPIATRLVNGNYVIAWRSDPLSPEEERSFSGYST